MADRSVGWRVAVARIRVQGRYDQAGSETFARSVEELLYLLSVVAPFAGRRAEKGQRADRGPTGDRRRMHSQDLRYLTASQHGRTGDSASHGIYRVVAESALRLRTDVSTSTALLER